MALAAINSRINFFSSLKCLAKAHMVSIATDFVPGTAGMLKFLGKIPFWLKTLIGFAAGVGVALYWGEAALPVVNPIGDTFIKAIKMLVAPLVFFTVASAVARLGADDAKDAGVTGGKAFGLGLHTVILYMVTSAFAVSVGLGLGTYFQPGQGVTGIVPEVVKPKIIPPPIDVLTGIVPSNVFQAFADGKVLSIVFFAILVGAAVASLGQKARDLHTILEQASKVMFKLVRWVIQLTPIGVFGLIGQVVASYGLAALAPLLPFIGLIYLGCAIVLLIIYPLLLKLHGLKVIAFYKNIFTAQQTAFFTCSSLGTLPVSMQVAVDNLKLKPSYAGFAIPLGANMKMDGCGGIYPAVAAIFTANYFGIHLTTAHYIAIALSSILGSLATAGVPGVATVMLTVTLTAANLPLEGIALLAAIDRIIDMMRTATNVTGQILVPTLVSKVHGLIEDGSPVLPQSHQSKAAKPAEA
jgi:Na+/H+-dicarboxylate symporter